MKLRNKKTGEIVEDTDILGLLASAKYDIPIYRSLAELNEEWEDYEEPKEYWVANFYGSVSRWAAHSWDEQTVEGAKEIGNYFTTEEEAKRAVERLKAWKRLKDAGFRFIGWHGYYGQASYTLPCVEEAEENPELDKSIRKDLDLLFGGEE